MVIDHFPADAIVCQCGADGIAGDPEASFNLTPQALIHCTQRLLGLQKPLVLLGGGTTETKFSCLLLHLFRECQ